MAAETETAQPPLFHNIFSRLYSRLPEVSAAALGILAVLAIILGYHYLNEDRWVKHTLEVKTAIAKVWNTLQNAQIQQRSFVYSGEVDFLALYKNAEAQINPQIDALADLTGDNPAQRSELSEIRKKIRDYVAAVGASIASKQVNPTEPVSANVFLAGDRRLSTLGDSLSAMDARESQLLRTRTTGSHQTFIVLSGILVAALFGLSVVLLSWIMNSRRQAAVLAASNKELRESIASREAAEAQVRQLQKMDAIGQLAGGIAHDFNNMLAVIMSGINLALRRISKTEPQAASFLQQALEGADKAAALVKRLLAFSRQQPLEPRPIDANKFVGGMSELVARTLGETIKTETVLGAGLWMTTADPAQLESALVNLCVNARDAMPDGGKLTIETANGHIDDHYARIHRVPMGQYVLIAVTDTGTGMEPAIADKAFDPFFTTKPKGKGTGLGLSQVYGFVKQSGGHIKIYSELGRGTTIKIYLPRCTNSGAKENQLANEQEIVGGRETVMVVEDEDKVLSLTMSLLKELGYRVVGYSSAADALSELGGPNHYDLLLTDIVMPEMTGRQLADKATGIRKSLRVVYMTGFTRNAVVHNGVLDQGVHFLAKPFTLDQLARKIRDAIGSN